jgi:hypothetical protein
MGLSRTRQRRTVNDGHAQVAGSIRSAHDRWRRSGWSPDMETDEAVLAARRAPPFSGGPQAIPADLLRRLPSPRNDMGGSGPEPSVASTLEPPPAAGLVAAPAAPPSAPVRPEARHKLPGGAFVGSTGRRCRSRSCNGQPAFSARFSSDDDGSKVSARSSSTNV